MVPSMSIARTSYGDRCYDENWIGLGVGDAIVGWFECTNKRYSRTISVRFFGLAGLAGWRKHGTRPADLGSTTPPSLLVIRDS